MRPLPTLLLVAGLSAASPAFALFGDSEARQQIQDLKIKTEARIDQQSRSQLELSAQIQRQAEEIARLRGQIETLTYELDNAKKRQQDFYLDLDTRLRRLEPQGGPVSGADAGAATAAAGSAAGIPDPARESRDYDAALALFKAGKYKAAASAFETFVGSYPASSLAPNAQFWLGNSWIGQHNCKRAIEAHNVVAAKFADSEKAPDAFLAIANCQRELGNTAAAKKTLDNLAARYPDSPAAKSMASGKK